MHNRKISLISLLFILISILIFSLFFASRVSAWMYTPQQVGMCKVEGSVNSAAFYFNGGDGTKDHPYEIDTPEQLYNLAWLQYIGAFNETDDQGNIIQTYFILTDTDQDGGLDMEGMVLPPIGTQNNPFFGNFDGNSLTIKNLVVSNELSQENITDYPPVVEDNTEFQSEGVEIVGLFGVVGELEEGSYSYDSSINEISNFYVDNLTVKTQMDRALIGVVAGYVNGTLSGVGVKDSTVEIVKEKTGAVEEITENLSDYTLVGYCREDYRDTLDVAKVQLALPSVQTDTYTKEQSGNDFGGSINMEEIYTRLKTIRDSITTESDNNYERLYLDDELIASDPTTTSVKALHTASGSYVFTRYLNSSTQLYDPSSGTTRFLYLWGGTRLRYTYTQWKETTGYQIARDGNYLGVTTTGSPSVTNVTNQEDAPYWILESNTYLFTVIGKTIYYLNYENNTLSLSTTKSTKWTKATSNGSTTFSFTSGNTSNNPGNNNTTTYYLYYSNGWNCTTSTTSYRNLTLTEGTTSYPSGTLEDSTKYNMDYTGDNVTWFPIKVDSGTDYPVAQKNTGYIISGGWDKTTPEKVTRNSGDIRISSYYKENNGSAIISNKTTPYTVVMDDKGNSRIETIDSTQEAAALGLEKYADSYSSFSKLMEGDNYYGLHFLNAKISKDSTLRIASATINEVTYTNYEVPTDCIDVSLPEKGYINFYAGTYYSGNDSFFSLHRVLRDENNNIEDILEISKIYKDIGSGEEEEGPQSYIYLCSDGNYYHTLYTTTDQWKTYEAAGFTVMEQLPEDMDLVFDLAWIGKWGSEGNGMTLESNSLYYFEVPVDAGEFAVGTVEGGVGAYLLYLDLATEAQKIENTTVKEKRITTTSTYEYPKGVDLVGNTQDGVQDTPALTLSIADQSQGTLSVGKTGDEVSISGTCTDYGSTVIRDGITLSVDLEPLPIQKTVEKLQLTTVNEYNTYTGTTIQTTYKTTISQDWAYTQGSWKMNSSQTVTQDPVAVSDREDVEATAFNQELHTNITIETPSSISIDSKELMAEYGYYLPSKPVITQWNHFMDEITNDSTYHLILSGQETTNIYGKVYGETTVFINQQKLTGELSTIPLQEIGEDETLENTYRFQMVESSED